MDVTNNNGNIAKRDLAISRSITEHAEKCPLHGTVEKHGDAIGALQVAVASANAKLWVVLAIVTIIAGTVLSMAFT